MVMMQVLLIEHAALFLLMVRMTLLLLRVTLVAMHCCFALLSSVRFSHTKGDDADAAG